MRACEQENNASCDGVDTFCVRAWVGGCGRGWVGVSVGGWVWACYGHRLRLGVCVQHCVGVYVWHARIEVPPKPCALNPKAGGASQRLEVGADGASQRRRGGWRQPAAPLSGRMAQASGTSFSSNPLHPNSLPPNTKTKP